MLGARRPDLLAVDNIGVIALFDRRGAQRQRIGAAGRLGHAKRLKTQLAGRNLGQIFRFLPVGAVPQNRAHRIHLGVAGGAVAAGFLDFLHDGGGGGDAETAAAEFFRYQHRQEAGISQLFHKFGRIGALAVLFAPVFAGEPGTELLYGIANVVIILGHRTLIAL